MAFCAILETASVSCHRQVCRSSVRRFIGNVPFKSSLELCACQCIRVEVNVCARERALWWHMPGACTLKYISPLPFCRAGTQSGPIEDALGKGTPQHFCLLLEVKALKASLAQSTSLIICHPGLGSSSSFSSCYCTFPPCWDRPNPSLQCRIAESQEGGNQEPDVALRQTRVQFPSATLNMLS